MKKNISVALLLVTLFVSCRSTERFGIDYMVPASVSFPPQLKRVAVVNNVSDIPDSQSSMLGETPAGAKELTYLNGEVAGLVAERFAEHVAATDYFDEVLIYDIALRAQDSTLREQMPLTQKEVKQLTEDLGVDVILSLENLLIRSVNAVEFIPNRYGYYGTLDVTVYPTIYVYVPSRNTPMAIINAADSIFWEKQGDTQASVTPVIPVEQMTKEIIDFAGSIPVKYLIPYWETADRYIYTGGSTDMRDAAVYVRNDQWEEACELWKRAGSSKRKRLQMYAALNTAVYYEMNDKIEEALKWATTAQTLAREIEKVKDETNINTASDYYYLTFYLSQLHIRKKNLATLNIQMERVKKDF